MDGHSSHYNLNVIREAAENGVILFCLPPNITHAAQPLYVTSFQSLKVTGTMLVKNTCLYIQEK